MLWSFYADSAPTGATSPHQQAPGCLCPYAGGILIEVALQGSKGAMPADLYRLMQAQAGLVGSLLRIRRLRQQPSGGGENRRAQA